jgi:hypothetical protein
MGTKESVREGFKESNVIQAKLAEAIETHNKATSRQNTLMVLLTVVIVVLTIFTLAGSGNGRYTSHMGLSKGLIILDTKTGHMWARSDKEFVDLGTIKKPMWGDTEIDETK